MQLAILLLQIAVIIALSRAMGIIFARFRQPTVIGEILAGIMLGPTLLGWVWPTGYHTLFPSGDSIQTLNMVAQIGVIIFLFLVGLEFDPTILSRRGKSAAAISICGIALPFVIGFFSTYTLLHLFDPEHQNNPLPTALFMGAAMSVTAFPVLARIVTERNLQKTEEGMMAIAAAAVDDVLAWTMLAGVVAFVPGGHGQSNPLLKLGGAIIYVGVMLLIVKPFLKRVEAIYERQKEITTGVIAILMVTMLLSSLTTELIGVHALFGAFVAGFVMPKGGSFVHDVTSKLQSFTIVFLLPAFFAYAGIKADLRTIMHWDMIGYTLVLIVLACLGKLGGGMIAARATGMSMRSSFTLGVLMNTRGLMELIILTVGLSLGVINQRVYGMMVVMALVTTGMAAPLLEWLLPSREKQRIADKIFSILIPVARPESGAALLEIASYLAGNDVKNSRICALHLSQPTDTQVFSGFKTSQLPAAQTEELSPLTSEASERNVQVHSISYYSRDVAADITRVSRQENIDLILMGHHTPVFGNALLGGVVHRVMTGADCDVAVFFNRDLVKPKKILVPFLNSTHDRLALELAGRIARQAGSSISIVHVTTSASATTARSDEIKSFKDPTQKEAVGIKIVHDDNPADAVLREAVNHDLIVIGVAEEWGLESSLIGLKAERIATESTASMLIVRRYVAEK